jgi:hypothetical protein
VPDDRVAADPPKRFPESAVDVNIATFVSDMAVRGWEAVSVETKH